MTLKEQRTNGGKSLESEMAETFFQLWVNIPDAHVQSRQLQPHIASVGDMSVSLLGIAS